MERYFILDRGLHGGTMSLEIIRGSVRVCVDAVEMVKLSRFVDDGDVSHSSGARGMQMSRVRLPIGR